MIDMISPAPCHKHMDVEKISHGKSASSSRTESVDSGERSAFAAKIIAPVCLHLVRRSDGGLVLEARQACRRKYSDRVNFSRFARGAHQPRFVVGNPETDQTPSTASAGCGCKSGLSFLVNAEFSEPVGAYDLLFSIITLSFPFKF